MPSGIFSGFTALPKTELIAFIWAPAKRNLSFPAQGHR